jgi:hypothetical protein
MARVCWVEGVGSTARRAVKATAVVGKTPLREVAVAPQLPLVACDA